MATANRLILILGALLLLLSSAALLVAVQLDASGVVRRVDSFVSWVDGRTIASLRLVTTIVAGAVAAAAAVLLGVEGRSFRTARQIRFRAPSGELIVVPVQSAEQLLSSDLELVPHVAAARASVLPRGAAAEVAVDLDLDPHAVISEVTRLVSRQVRATMTQKLGIGLRGRPTVAVHYDELVLQQRADRQPAVNATQVDEFGVPLAGGADSGAAPGTATEDRE